jgi:hypothetical protein
MYVCMCLFIISIEKLQLIRVLSSDSKKIDVASVDYLLRHEQQTRVNQFRRSKHFRAVKLNEFQQVNQSKIPLHHQPVDQTVSC